MSDAHQRGLLLLQQGRPDLADREFRQQLAQDPNDPLAHAFLSLCLNRRDKDDEAMVEADEAIRCGPNIPFCHYVRGCALQSKHRLPEAEAAALEAIELDPEDADYPGLLASIAMERRDWNKALMAADRGLSLDPENAGCLNLRAMALVQLGRRDEASKTLGSALADNPDNALTHANQGWALLHKGDHAQALEHFREALRIEPDLDWARSGIVEALKARFLIYRLMLGFFLWMGRQSSMVQWVVVVAFVFGRQFLARIEQAKPELAPFIMPVLVLSFAFLMMTWVSSPLFNLTLRFNRFGRLALTDDQRTQSSWIGVSFFLAAGFFLIYLLTGSDHAFLAMIYFGLMLFPMAVAFRQPLGKPRRLASLYAMAVAVVGATSLALIFLNIGSLGGVATVTLFQGFVWGAVLSTWLSAFFGPTRLGR